MSEEVFEGMHSVEELADISEKAATDIVEGWIAWEAPTFPADWSGYPCDREFLAEMILRDGRVLDGKIGEYSWRENGDATIIKFRVIATPVDRRKSEAVNHPAHYNQSEAKCLGCGRPIECIDVIEHMPLNIGNAVKYAWRCDLKNDSIEDLKKSIWYLQREIEKRLRE